MSQVNSMGGSVVVVGLVVVVVSGAVVVVAAAGGSDALAPALAYYKGIQNDDGGWPYQNPSEYGTATDANSTAVTIQAIIAAGQDPARADWTTGAGNTPVAALEALQNESGAFAWQAAMPDDNLLATIQALPALAGKAFPFATMAVGEAAAPATVPQTGVLAVITRRVWPSAVVQVPGSTVCSSSSTRVREATPSRCGL